MIGLSLSVYSNFQFLSEEITAIRTVTNIPIIIGGQGMKNVGAELSDKSADVSYCADLEGENYIEGCA